MIVDGLFRRAQMTGALVDYRNIDPCRGSQATIVVHLVRIDEDMGLPDPQSRRECEYMGVEVLLHRTAARTDH